MNYRNLLQAVLFPVILFVIRYLFGLLGFDAGGEIANQLSELIVAALLTWFFGDVAKAFSPKHFM